MILIYISSSFDRTNITYRTLACCLVIAAKLSLIEARLLVCLSNNSDAWV